jgi:hypothetical protein
MSHHNLRGEPERNSLSPGQFLILGGTAAVVAPVLADEFRRLGVWSKNSVERIRL